MVNHQLGNWGWFIKDIKVDLPFLSRTHIDFLMVGEDYPPGSPEAPRVLEHREHRRLVMDSSHTDARRCCGLGLWVPSVKIVGLVTHVHTELGMMAAAGWCDVGAIVIDPPRMKHGQAFNSKLISSSPLGWLMNWLMLVGVEATNRWNSIMCKATRPFVVPVLSFSTCNLSCLRFSPVCMHVCFLKPWSFLLGSYNNSVLVLTNIWEWCLVMLVKTTHGCSDNAHY